MGNAAAALAAASIVWETVDSAYAAQALLAAKDLYTFAQSVSDTINTLTCMRNQGGMPDSRLSGPQADW